MNFFLTKKVAFTRILKQFVIFAMADKKGDSMKNIMKVIRNCLSKRFQLKEIASHSKIDAAGCVYRPILAYIRNQIASIELFRPSLGNRKTIFVP